MLEGVVKLGLFGGMRVSLSLLPPALLFDKSLLSSALDRSGIDSSRLQLQFPHKSPHNFPHKFDMTSRDNSTQPLTPPHNSTRTPPPPT